MSEKWISHDGQAPIAEREALPAYDPVSGDSAQRRWEGSREQIRAMFFQLRAQGIRCRMTEGSGEMSYLLTADFGGVLNPSTGEIDPTATTIVTEWTSDPATFSKSIWELPVVVREFDKLGDDDLGLGNARKLRNYIDALNRGETTIPDPSDEKGLKTLQLSTAIVLALVAQLGMSTTVFRLLLKDLARGVTSWSPAAWTLRRTRRIPASVSFVESSANVGRMLTYGALLSEGFHLAALRTEVPTAGFWHKQHPVDRPLGDGTREVVTEYWWAEAYSTFIYGLPV